MPMRWHLVSADRSQHVRGRKFTISGRHGTCGTTENEMFKLDMYRYRYAYGK